MKIKDSAGYLAGLTLLLTLGFLVLWEFWLESLILVDYLEIEVHKNFMDRWTFVVSALAIVCLSLVLPFRSMKATADEMKGLEIALHGEQALSKIFFTVDNSLILVIDTSNRIMQINQKTIHLLGFKEDEMVGKDWISLLVKEKNQDGIKTQYKQFVSDKNQNFIRFTASIKTKSGSEKMIDWQCSPLRDEKGRVYGTINSGQDISEQIRLRNEISQIKGKYEPQIKKLTADLNFNKKKYHSEAIKSASTRARFKFWFDLESALIGLSPSQISNPDEVAKGIKKTLQLFGELSNVDQGYIFKFTKDGSHMVNTQLWVSGEPLLEADSNEEFSLDNYPWFKKKIFKKDVIHIPNIKEMPKEAESEREVYLSQGIKSIINAPIIQGDSVVGYMGFESSQKEKVWDIDEINVIRVITRLISKIWSTPSSPEPQPEAGTPELTNTPELADVPEPGLEENAKKPESPQTPSEEASPSLENELEMAKAGSEKELREKLDEMEKAHSQLLSEMKERKQAEADLRTSRDSIERELGEKSLQLEKLLAEADADTQEKPPLGTDVKKAVKEGKLEASSHSPKSDEGEIEKMSSALQKKENELASLQNQLKSKAGGLMAAEVQEFKTKIAEKDTELKSLRKKFEEGNSAKIKLEEKLKEVQNSIKKHQGEMKSLKEANKGLEVELDELRKIHEDFDSSADKLEDTRQELESLEIANEQLMTDIEDKNYTIDEINEKATRYEKMDLPIFTLDQEGVILTWNRTAASLTGYISELALDMPISFMFDDENEFDFENQFLAPLRENSKLRIEIPIKIAKGTVFNSLISIVSFKGKNDVVSNLGYFVNLSETDDVGDIHSTKMQFTTLLGNSGLILVNLSPDYRITDTNEKMEAILQWNKESALDKNFFEMALAGDNWEDVYEDIEGRMSSQDTVDLETTVLSDDETERTFLWNLIKEIDPKDKSVKGILAIAQDITELRKAQNQLNENEFVLNLIVDKAEDGLITIDENGIIQSFNEGAENLFGYVSQEIVGKNVSHLMPAPYSKEHDNYIKNYIDRGSSSFIGGPPKELIGKNKNGTTFPLEITLREIYKGYQKMFIGIARNISKRKETEIQLVEVRGKYQRIMDAELDAVLVVDSNTQQILESNPAALSLYGYESEEFIKLNFKDLIAESDPLLNGGHIVPISGLGSTQKISQLYQKKKDGGLFPASITTSSFRLRDTDFELKIIRDISAEVLLEEKLKEKQDQFDEALLKKENQLEEIIKQSEDQEAALRQEKLNAVQHITSSMVDLINNPIQGIENILEQVKERAEMADIHKGLVTVAMNECRRVADLVGKMKIFQPPAEEDLESLDVHQVLDEILQSNMGTLHDRTITLEKQYADQLPAIEAVTQQIRQAINNIIKNAEESFSEDEGKITISTEQDGSNVKIHIQDTGCGIPEKEMGRIFDPFYTTKSAAHRPGLGLLASLGIVQNHNGDIEVHSQLGEGTTFTVTLPLKQPVTPSNGDS